MPNRWNCDLCGVGGEQPDIGPCPFRAHYASGRHRFNKGLPKFVQRWLVERNRRAEEAAR